MRKTYFAWANPQRTAWIEMTGEEFYQFINQEENKHRKFIPADDEYEETENSFIYMEVSIEDYREWDRKRKKRERELEKKSVEIVSAEMVISMDKDGFALTLGDTLCEDTSEQERLEDLLFDISVAINELSAEEQRIIKAAFSGAKKQNDDVIAAYLGMQRTTFRYHKKKILEKLREKLSK